MVVPYRPLGVLVVFMYCCMALTSLLTVRVLRRRRRLE